MRDRQTDIQTETERKTQTETERDRQRDRYRETQAQTKRYRDREKQRDRQRGVETETESTVSADWPAGDGFVSHLLELRHLPALFAGCLLGVPSTCLCFSETDLLQQLYVLPL